MTVRERVTDEDRARVLDVLGLSAAGSSIPDLAEMLDDRRVWLVSGTLRNLRREGVVERSGSGTRDELGHRIWRVIR